MKPSAEDARDRESRTGIDPSSAPDTVPGAPANDGEAEGPVVQGRVKWFDATRGFGFLVSEDFDADVLVHFSVLREHGRRSLPEGAICEFILTKQERGLQAKRIVSIDLSEAVPVTPRASTGPAVTSPPATRASRYLRTSLPSLDVGHAMASMTCPPCERSRPSYR